MLTDYNLPCDACCHAGLSCCHNPQITWTMQEFDDLITEYGEKIMAGVQIYKAEIPGMIYLIRVNPEVDNARLDYCAFYNPDNFNCSVYDKRPIVCQTYGDPKYNECPYDGLKEEELKDLAENEPKKAMTMHKEAKSNYANFTNDIIIPWLKAWEEAKEEHPEYSKWWESLPTANFIRK